MSDLQIGLLVIGAIVVAAVLAYNKWQEFRYRRQAEAGFRSRYDDVLMRTGGRGETGTQSAAAAAERIEPGMGAGDAARAQPGADGELAAEPFEWVIPVEAPEDIRGSVMLDAAAAALAGRAQRVRWEGLDAGRARWEAVRAAASYSRLRALLQLVNRHGAIGADELAAIGAGVEQAAAAAGALATLPDSGPALVRAQELDRICSELDIQIALNVVSESTAFTGIKVHALAEAAGLALDDRDGRFRRRDDAGRELFSLSNLGPEPFRSDAMKSLTSRGLTLELDVPRAPRGAFEGMLELARSLAQALDARVVDDNRQPLGASGFEAIRSQLRAVYDSMESRGFAAGSASALRLFS